VIQLAHADATHQESLASKIMVRRSWWVNALPSIHLKLQRIELYTCLSFELPHNVSAREARPWVTCRRLLQLGLIQHLGIDVHQFAQDGGVSIRRIH